MRRLLLPLVLAASCAPAFAVERDFGDVVRALSDEFHTRPTRIPLFGLVNAFTFVARPAGARHIDLAIFENLSMAGRDTREVMDKVKRAVGRGWAPFVSVRSRRAGQEQLVLVYMRTEGRNCRLLVTSVEPNEAVVVELKVNPDGLRQWIGDPEESALSIHGSGTDVP